WPSCNGAISTAACPVDRRAHSSTAAAGVPSTTICCARRAAPSWARATCGPTPPITSPPTIRCAAVPSRIREHYATASLGERVDAALARVALAEGPIDWPALAPIDEFH